MKLNNNLKLKDLLRNVVHKKKDIMKLILQILYSQMRFTRKYYTMKQIKTMNMIKFHGMDIGTTAS